MHADTSYVFMDGISLRHLSAFIGVHFRYSLTSLAAILLLALADDVAAQALRPGRLSKEETAALVPGLRLDLSSEHKRDARLVRVAALHVPKDAAPTPFLPAGNYSVEVSGHLKVPLKGAHTFYVHANGSFTLSINGAIVLAHATDKQIDAQVADVALVKGYNAIQLRTNIAADRASSFRIEWSGADFVKEPLPADSLFTRGDDAALVTGRQQRAGRELFATRSCLKCHALDDPLLPSADGMPELAFTAPSLKGVGSRLNEAWLRAWILNPKAMRPSATMPHVLKGDAAAQAQAAADIAAYLASLTTAELPTVEGTEEQVAEGVKLFENLGCVACHSIKPPAEEDPFARHSLHFVKAKFAPGQLAAFLKAPHAHYAWSRMPDFKLSVDEVTALTAFLAARAQGEVEIAQDAPAGDAGRGKTLFNTAGCIACHVIAEVGADKKLTMAADRVSKGCLASPPSEKAPDFAFTAEQSAALQAFLTAELNNKEPSSLSRETTAEFSQRQVQSLNCIACHRRDGANSVLNSVLQEESEQGLTPEVLPLLTWTGEKLKPAWSEKLLAGELDQRARPWLRARMPAFPARAKGLSLGLSHEHGFAIDENPTPAHDAELAKVGEQLVGENQGFSCVKCHAIGKRPPLQPFEAPGINLVSAAERLRYTYYPRWMIDPPRVDVLTKMPKFAADGKTTGVTAVFEGDAAKQYDALWHYIQTLPTTEGR